MKNTIKTKIFFFLAALLAFGTGLPHSFAASVVANDTIAGYSTTIRAVDVTEKRKIVFRIKNPEGDIIEIQKKSDESGIAEISYAGFHTKVSGVYKVWVFEEGKRPSRVPNATFEVFADTVSPLLSRVRAIIDSAPADGEAAVKVQVKLRDRYGNPVENHFVELISSRSEDEILAKNGGATDANGSVLFFVRSKKVGVSHFTALDRNSGVLPEERAKAVFFEYEEDTNKSVLQANLFGADLFTEPTDDSAQYGAIDHFNLQVDFPNGNNVITEPATLIITAMDSENRVVKNYVGTAVLEAMSGVSKLPNDGTIEFTVKDQGRKQLDLALTFDEEGSHTITATEFEDGGYTDITGTTTVDVLSECKGSQCTGNNTPILGTSIEIDRPEDGATYGSKKITLKGSALPDTELQVFIDDVAVQTLFTDEKGEFFDDASFRVEKDGKHTLYVQEMEMEEKSEVISFFIDTTPPEIKSSEIDPKEEVEPEEMVTVTLFSEQNVEKAVLNIEESNIHVDFTEDKSIPGKYTATFRAPKKSGEYSVRILLRDTYYNESKSTIGNIVVGEKEPDGPGKPQNVRAQSGDGMVTVSWDAPANGKVAKYRILYGTNELFLDKTGATTDGETTTQEIHDLKNGEKLYFGVIAVDKNGLQGEMSNIVSATPEGEEVPEPQEPVEPEVIDVKKSITATAGNGMIQLRWSDPSRPTAYFDIRFGLSSGKYTERFAVLGNARIANVPDLINGVAYYFTVVPLDENGIPTGEIYGEEYAMPMFTGIHNAPMKKPAPIQKVQKLDKTGPQDIFLALLSLSFAMAMFFFHRAFSLATTKRAI